MAEITIQNLRKEYGSFTAVEGSSFTIDDGEFFVMLGPSGCGKTTTLRMIAGLEVPTDGLIHLGDEDVTYNPGSKRDLAFVFQMFALYPHMSVEKNISFPLRVQGLPRKVIQQKVGEVASMLQIEHLLKSGVGGLSSGDRQRVALGRALIREAKAFLMDEPLGALDAEFRDLMCEELRLLHNRVKATTVYVTHDQIEAMSMADRICIMDQARVLQIGSPEEVYQRPRTKFVAGFVGSPSMNFIAGEGRTQTGASQIAVKGGTVPVPIMHEEVRSQASIIGARPEHLSLSDKGHVRGEVFGVEYMGARQLVTVDTPSGRLRARADNQYRVSVGDNIGLEFDQSALVVFDGASELAIDSDLFRSASNG